MNFNAYINLYRIEMAKKLLVEKGGKLNSLTEVGLEVGFANPSSFSRTFKKMTGYTPSEFYKLNNR